MTDKITPEQRRKIMQAVKSKSKLEDIIAKELWKRNIRYRRNVKSLFGKPDIAIKKYKVVIFVDACFWHGCSLHGAIPKSNIDFWKAKLDRNKKRDSIVNSFYKENGWYIFRVWEHDIKEDFELTMERIINFIDVARANYRDHSK
ncbi:MAG TPA: very short patch repair endonuclease [Clostridiales bacterium]|nr:very short patch repair endonuclease [Clostridiales bacterium]